MNEGWTAVLIWLIAVAVTAGRLRRLRPHRLEQEAEAMAAYYVAAQRWDMPPEPEEYERLIRRQAYASIALVGVAAIVTTVVAFVA